MGLVVSVVKSQHQCILEQTNAIVVDFCDWEKSGGFSAANVEFFWKLLGQFTHVVTNSKMGTRL
jgi:hypothetical protein